MPMLAAALLLAARTLDVSIDRPPRDVYEFVTDPRNIPTWAQGLGKSVAKTPQGWVVETADGPAEVKFAPRNELGVADHTVTLKSGVQILVPVRVLPSGKGSAVTLTVFRLPDVSDEKFAADLGLVERDLATLKRVMEHGTR